LAQPLLANKALAAVTSAGFISALVMLAAAPSVRARIKWRLEMVGMASAPVGCVAEYCPNGDWENLGSRSKNWVTGSA
jgi:hypothetical protein